MSRSQIKVFPVVERIRNEIDFCFSAFNGDMDTDQEICDAVYNDWIKKGYRGPGQLTIYIDMLSQYLITSTQKKIFTNLAHDAITLKRKVDIKKQNFFQRNKIPIITNIAVILLIILVLIYGKLVFG